MSRLWQSGFELNSAGANVEFTGTVGGVAPTIDSSIKRTGSYSLKATPGASATTSGLVYNFASANSQGVYYLRAYFYIDTAPTGTIAILGFRNSSNQTKTVLRMTSGRQLQLYNAEDSAQIGSSSAALNLATWYRLEMKADYTTLSAVALEGKVDGVAFASGTADIATGVNNIFCGVGNSNANTVFYCDDLALNDNTGSFQNSYPDSGSIIHLRPNAAGDVNGFAVQVGGTAGSSNNFTRVNEVPPDDATTYNSSAVLNAEDLFNCDDSGLSSNDVITLVAVGVRMADLVSADATAILRLEIEKAASGTKLQSGDLGPNTTTWVTNLGPGAAIKNYPLVAYQDPDASNWTPTTLDSMQIGYILSSAHIQAVAVSNVWASVEYIPPLSINISNSITLTESVSAAIQATTTPVINVSDPITLTENILVVLSDPKVNVTDSMSITESVGVFTNILYVSVSDSITVSESKLASVAATTTLIINISDTATLTESSQVSFSFSINVSDSVALTENMSTQLIFLVNKSDSILIYEGRYLGYGSAVNFVTTSTDKVVTDVVTHATLRSYSAWVYRRGAGGGGIGRIFDKRVAGSQVELWNSDLGGGTWTYERDWSTGTPKWQITAPSSNAWHHIVVTYDSSSSANNAIWYVDGVTVVVNQNGGAFSGTPNTNTDAFVIGNRGNDNARGWDGLIDDFRIYDRILTQQEVTDLYVNKIDPATPLTHFKFDEGSGSSAADSSGNGYTGTLTGATFITTAGLNVVITSLTINISDSVTISENVSVVLFGLVNVSDSVTLTENTSIVLLTNVFVNGIASASNQDFGAAALAFDHNLDSPNYWGGSIPSYLEYDLGSRQEKVVIHYTLHGHPDYVYLPTDWTFEGSNDNSNWTVLDTQSSVVWDATGWKDYIFSNTIAYRYYRLNVTANGGGTFIQVDELEAYAPTITIDVFDSVSVSESTSLLKSNNINVSNSVTVSEAVSVSMPVLGTPITVSDSITLTENVSVSLQATAILTISTSNSITVTESLALLNTLMISLGVVLDKHQDNIGTSFGSGQFAAVRYRGQVFTAGVSGNLTALGFDRVKGSKGVKVYLDTASANVPDNAVGSELYSFTIPNSALTNGYAVYDLPVPLALTSGTKYCFYIAPWNTTTDLYADEYEDSHGVTGGSLEITNNNGVWSNENLTYHYATYMENAERILLTEGATVLPPAGLGISVSKTETVNITENVVLDATYIIGVSDSIVASENINRMLLMFIVAGFHKGVVIT